MEKSLLTTRQRRESQFYEEYFRKPETQEITFDPVLEREQRPWCPYWRVYALVKAAYVHPCQRILDFGCGIGKAAIRFAFLGYEAHGFDLTASSIAVARSLAAKHGYAGRTYFTVQAAEQLDYPSEYFDLVAGIDILHHVEIEPAIRQCLRVLKPGGVAVFKEWLEVPMFDAVRNTRLVQWLVPNDQSQEKHITQDERKLTQTDLALIQRLCPRLSVERFMLFARLNRLLRGTDPKNAARLERFDWGLFQRMPWLRSLGGAGVLILTKT